MSLASPRRAPFPWRPLLLAYLLVAGPASASDWIYTVVDGDNLWNLSERYLDSTLRYEALRKINGIERPRRMLPGTRLRIPLRWIRSNPVEASVDAVHGRAEILRRDGSQTPVTEPGAALQLGDRLRTSQDSSVAVRFADGSIITLHQNSEMRFDHLSAHGETGMVDSRLRLLDGRLDTRVTPAVGPGSRFEIHTPSAVSAVRGTRYRAATLDDGQTSNIEVVEGRVAVAARQRSRIVPTGFGTQVAQGKPPSPPRELLPPPRIDPPTQPIRRPGAPLTWQPLAGASRYRTAIARDASFDVVLAERVVTKAQLRLPDVADGEYAIRVRGIDAQGLEGRDSTARLEFDTHPRPPVPLQPVEGAVLRETAATLVWTASDEADSYRLEIARDAAFSNVVAVHDGLNGTRHEATGTIEPGEYYWRVSSIAEDGETGPPGDTRHWQVKAIPEAVDAKLTGDTDGLLIASWPTAGPGVEYQVQLAYDRNFDELEIDRLTDEARLEIEPLSGQVRFLRVRLVEDDGYRGPWGTVQRVNPPPDPFVWLVPALGVLGILLL